MSSDGEPVWRKVTIEVTEDLIRVMLDLEDDEFITESHATKFLNDLTTIADGYIDGEDNFDRVTNDVKFSSLAPLPGEVIEGTGILNKPEEIYNLIRVIDPQER